MKTSNKFTLVRIVFAPVFFILYFIPVWTGFGASLSVYFMIPLLAFAEFTDYLDGHFARKHNEVSDFGKMFDPFADVFLHLTSFACFTFGGINASAGGYMPLFLFILIFYREFGMNFVRMAAAKQGVAIAARKGGKFKTVLYIVTEFYVLAVECAVRLDLPVDGAVGSLRTGAVALFVLCVVASYASFIDYLVHFGALLSEKSTSKKNEKKV